MEPFIGLIARDTIRLKRLFDGHKHAWEPIPNDKEYERCPLCHVEATEQGKQHLAFMEQRARERRGF